MARQRLGDILIRAGLLDEAGLQRALNEQQRWGGQLGRYLVELGLISEEILMRALSTQYKVPAVALDPARIDLQAGRLIPREICERNNLICFRAEPQKRFLDVAMSDPTNLDAIDEVRVATKYNVRPYIAAPTVIDRAIAFVFYGDLELVGGNSLSPESDLRLDTRGSELLQRAQSRPAPSAPLAPRPTPAEELPQLDVKVSVAGEPVSAPQGAPPPRRKTPIPSAELEPIALPDPKREPDAGFHITMEVPAPDKEDIARISLESQLTNLEAVVTRNTEILKALLEGLARKGLFTKEEIRRILGGK